MDEHLLRFDKNKTLVFIDCETFNLCLNTISTAQANTIDSNLDSRNVNLRLYGLPFINQTYNVKNGGNTNCTSIGTFNFVPSAATTQYYYSNNIATFGKNQELCNITLEYARIYDDQVPIIAYGTDITAATGTGAQNSNQITVSISGGIVVGSKITSAAGIPANTYITAINSTGLVLTISNILTAAINSAILTISPLTSYPNILFLFDIFGIPDDGALPERLPLK